MKKTALGKGSTQKFTEVKEVSDSLVFFKDQTAVSVVEVNATNFSLQSQVEQGAKIAAYGAFLNSLSFSVQIVIRSHRLDISTYLSTLDTKANQAKDQKFSDYIRSYKNFVEELLRSRTVLDKKFYIVIPFHPLEKGIKGAPEAASKHETSESLMEAKTVLKSKTETVLSQISRIGLSAKVLSKEELIALFHDFYNGGLIESFAHEVHNPWVTSDPSAGSG